MTPLTYPRQTLTRATLAVAVVAAAISALAPVASAGPRYGRGPDQGYVVAESRFGNGTVTGAVRVTNRGRQVQTPGGNWEYCQRSCSETLRVKTVDFWEAQRGLTNQCGILGCLELRYPR